MKPSASATSALIRRSGGVPGAEPAAEGARLAVRRLHELGHRRIATIAGLPETKPGGDRLRGYRAEVEALGLDVIEGVGDFYADSGEAARLAHPRLTIVRHDKVGLGLAAAVALVHEIEHPGAGAPPPVTLPVELVVRESTAPAATR